MEEQGDEKQDEDANRNTNGCKRRVHWRIEEEKRE